MKHSAQRNRSPHPSADGRARAAAAEELPSRGLLSFYDSLRARVVEAVDRRGGRLGKGATEALMAVPDIFILLLRLALDRRVPKPERALIASALAYFVLPFDLLPEAVIGGMGYMDDLFLAVAVLSQAFGEDLEPLASQHWSGSRKLRSVLRDLSGTAHSLLGEDLFGRLERLLARRGVRLAPRRPSGS